MVMTAKVLLVAALLAAAGVAEVAAKPPGGAEAEVKEGETEVIDQDDSIAGEGTETGDVAVDNEEEQEDKDEGAEGEAVEKDAVEEKAGDTEDKAASAEASKTSNSEKLTINTTSSVTSAFEGSGASSSSSGEPVKADIADSVVEKVLVTVTDKPEVKSAEKPEIKEEDQEKKTENKGEDKSAPTAEKQKQDDLAVKKEPAKSEEVVKPVEDDNKALAEAVEGDKAPGETVDYDRGDVTPEVVYEKSISKEGEPASQSHFFAYFIVLAIVTIVAYLVFHNKKKILGLIVEGRGSQARRRRSGGKEYRKLDTGLEDMMETGKETSMRQVIY